MALNVSFTTLQAGRLRHRYAGKTATASVLPLAQLSAIAAGVNADENKYLIERARTADTTGEVMKHVNEAKAHAVTMKVPVDGNGKRTVMLSAIEKEAAIYRAAIVAAGGFPLPLERGKDESVCHIPYVNHYGREAVEMVKEREQVDRMAIRQLANEEAEKKK